MTRPRRALIALAASTAAVALACTSASAAIWSPVGTGTNGPVNDIASDAASNVYAGGRFTTAGGTATNNIAEWNGSAWMGLSTGTNGTVYSVMVSPGGQRYVGGRFTQASLNGVSNIAQWNGISFQPLTQGVNEAVWSMAASSTAFYAAGDFTAASGTATNNIGRWQATGWSFLGANQALNGRVNALVFAPNGDLYVGGSFDAANGVAGTARIARWNGAQWQSVGGGIDPNIGATAQRSWVEDMVFDAQGNLYVGGFFTGAAGVAAPSVAMWDGARWRAVGTPAAFNNSIVRALEFDSAGTLYAGGSFAQIGTTSAAKIAQWNGAAWTQVGSGMNGDVYTLHRDARGNLYAGGEFSQADGVTANNIAVIPAVVPPTPPAPAPCASTFYQQGKRTWKNATAPGGRASVKVTSRIRIYQDTLAACRKDLTFILRDARTKKRLAQLPGSTLGYRTLQGQDFSAPVVSWPTNREMRFTGGDTTGQNRKNARLVLVSYLRKTRTSPAQRNVELVIVRQVPRDAGQPVSATNPLFAQLNAFGTTVGWAQTS